MSSPPSFSQQSLSVTAFGAVMHLKECRCSCSTFQEGGEAPEKGAETNCNCRVLLGYGYSEPELTSLRVMI